MADAIESSSRELQPLKPPEGLSVGDYEMIEDAVMETARGRWFLKEYARRMRAAETAGLRTALERIERVIARSHPPHPDNARQTDVTEKLEGICERLLDLAWFMRERGIDNSSCTAIESEARQIASVAATFASRTGDDGPSKVDVASDAGPEVSSGNTTPPQPGAQQSNVAFVADDAEAGIAAAAEPAEEIQVEPQPLQAAGQKANEPMCNAGAKAETPAAQASAPSLGERLRAFVHIERMPVRQRLALFA